ncbi:MAG: zf-HC2 domain-containing protein [Acidobacteria bacterium]|nr:zf-HC2 domain-containing protein [Acidobacteriota bacterium]
MVVNCDQVWQQISNYIDGDVDPSLRAAMEAHVEECKRCKAVLEGTRNIVQLFGDERMIDVPLGYEHRLERRLEQTIYPRRRSFLGWVVAATAAVLVGGSFEVARSFILNRVEPRSEHAQAGAGVPPNMMVVVSEEGKLFHAAGCPFIHDQAHLRTVVARDAIKQGYTPCMRCMKKYLQAVVDRSFERGTLRTEV